MLFPATLGPWPHGGLVCSTWDTPVLFQTQLSVRLIFLLFFPLGLWGCSVGGSAGCVGSAMLVGCRPGLSLCTEPFPQQQQPSLEQRAPHLCLSLGLMAPLDIPRPGGTLWAGGDTETPDAGCPGSLERLRSGVSPSKQFWMVGWLPRSKTKCHVCRKQAGGTACLSFEWKTRSEEQNPALEGSL